ncbi:MULTISPECIES: CAP domain-containing protein [Clostridium]|jgi:uncharacterized YkwD family protein|uniref:Cysteine-rich secretory protein family protein n=2 Tax=Clostridium TaxID=1485 RepID=A0A151ANL5_9CLOT|nr:MULTISPECIES: CAP domain-containing protein [Clostridium]KYH29150.1 cysteine-rich secretory protein family protein [Clostridium colicanis DSM 13634]MBE6043740.1 serine protease [Clostridium thermopalmarium]PRR73791.1 Cysteine-rich secretory protein family protein [Clostridium thermopalmarium DSM 5974]PVZ21170.1 putative YkwD family protein [Clostridium thermopalmarium DSM 5974]
MKKNIKMMIASLAIAGALPTIIPTTAIAAQTNCTTSISIQQNWLKDFLNKYPQFKNCKIITNVNTNTKTKQTSNNTITPTKPTETTTSKPADSETSKPTQNNEQTSTISAEANKVIELVNAERSKNGLAPLKANAELSKVAVAKAQDMIDKNYFDHNSPTYGSPFDMMKKFGISYIAAGENIAYGQKTPSEVMNAWMNSSGHRANILNANFTEIGVGMVKKADGTPYWVQMFINPGK